MRRWWAASIASAGRRCAASILWSCCLKDPAAPTTPSDRGSPLARPPALPCWSGWRPPDAAAVALLGYGESSDAYHMSAPHPEGKGAILAMEAALARAGLAPEDIDYINLHGTGSRANDRMEDLAVTGIFGSLGANQLDQGLEWPLSGGCRDHRGGDCLPLPQGRLHSGEPEP